MDNFSTDHHKAPGTHTTIERDGDTVTISHLVIDDPAVARFLESHTPDRWAEEIEQALAVGVRGITAMGAGISLDDIATEVRRIIDAADAATTNRVGSALERGSQIIEKALDPSLDTSLTGRTLARFGETADNLAGALDPNRRDSHGARLLDRIEHLVGQGGSVETMLTEALDGTRDESSLGRLRTHLSAEIRELRDLVMTASGRTEEAERGTAKGFDYEAVVGDHLRSAAKAIGGATVEETGRITGTAGNGRLVGDFVVNAPCGTRVVVEAKNTSQLTLTGAGGVLDELERAMANRGAEWAICVSARDAFPGEVGTFGIYGNRVLVVDDGDGAMLGVALRWVIAMAAHRVHARVAAVDVDAVADRLERISALSGHISRTKKNLAGVLSSVGAIRNDLDDLRVRLVDLVEEAVVALAAGQSTAEIGDLIAAGVSPG